MKTKNKQKYDENTNIEPTIIVNMGITQQDKMRIIKEYLMFCWEEEINPECSYSLIMFEEYLTKQYKKELSHPSS